MKNRGFCFTINNYNDSDLAFIMDKDHIGYRYLVAGFEIAPTTGTPHIQGYLYFENARSIKTIRALFYPNHVEAQKARDNLKAINYCKGICEDKIPNQDVYEYGEIPQPGRALFETIVNAMESPEQNFMVYHQYRKTYKDYINSQKKTHERILHIVHDDDKYDYFKQYQSISFDYELYDSEQLIVHTTYTRSTVIDRWINGYPEKVKRGYEIIPIDPPFMCIIYNEPKELAYIRKTYDHAILWKHNI